MGVTCCEPLIEIDTAIASHYVGLSMKRINEYHVHHCCHHRQHHHQRGHHMNHSSHTPDLKGVTISKPFCSDMFDIYLKL